MKKRQSTRTHTSRKPDYVKTIPTPASRAGLAPDLLDKIDAYWRAANYLSVGQIYLFKNPLLKKPLMREHIKPRLLGHWGTTPGLNFAYVHLNPRYQGTGPQCHFHHRTGTRRPWNSRKYVARRYLQRSIHQRLPG
jgi:phosphoketolase